jgi:hypothetical protein
MAAAKEDSNDKTIDQQNIDESKQLAKASDSLATQEQITPLLEEDFQFQNRLLLKKQKLKKEQLQKQRQLKCLSIMRNCISTVKS